MFIHIERVQNSALQNERFWHMDYFELKTTGTLWTQKFLVS